MSASEIEAAKREARRARRELDATLGALQLRLHPRALATDAWDGVKEKSGDLADSALGAVRERPAAVSMALGAAILFLARQPLRRAVGRMFSKEEAEDDRITTRIDTDAANYSPAAPIIKMPSKEGAVS